MTDQTPLVLTGLNHRTAPVELRERFAFDQESTSPALTGILGDLELHEAALVSTCNRTELYAVADRGPAATHRDICRWLAARIDMPPAELDPHLYHRHGGPAVEHLFRVAAGLDSLILGEPQILGQVRSSFETAREAGTLGRRLGKLFRSAVETGKTVRSSTALGEMPVSVASVAVQLVERVFGDLSARSVLVVGAGEICTAAARHLAERQPDRLVVVNRTRERAEELAGCCCGAAAPWSSLCDELVLADVVLTSTGAKDPPITREMLADVMKRRRGQRLLLVDVAVPRDVEPSAGTINNVYLYCVDDLEELAAENLRHRESEVPHAERIVERSKEQYLAWEESLAVVPTIVALRGRMEVIRREGVEQYVTKIPELDEKGRRCIDQMTQTIVNRILHEPQTRLKNGAGRSKGAAMVESLRYLFALDGPSDKP